MAGLFVRRTVQAVVVCSGLVLAGIPVVATAQASGPPSCPAPAAGQVSCAALATSSAAAMTGAAVEASGTTPPGYGPSGLRSAYGLASYSPIGGTGQTVAVVTAYDDATAETDMATYRSQYGLSACGSGCFSKVNETGGSTYPPAGPAGWSLVTAEDLDMISAICPNCHILLVEATTTAITDLGTAENEAVTLGAKFVTNTWFTPEATYGTSEPTYDTDYFNHPGVAITAPDGNGGGYGTYYPAASPDVIAVGGTTLTQDTSTARGWTETAWSDTGSGCSPYEAKPSWQTDTGCSDRTLNDVSAVADPNTPVAIYDTNSGDWVEAGGEGVAAAIIAAAYALGGAPAAGSYPAAYLYSHPSLFNDITSGSDGTCTPTYLCTAGAGFDGPTGLGTPAGALGLDFGMATGTSPAIGILPGGGWVAAFQANTNDLTISTSAGTLTNTTLGMVKGTSPAIAVLPDGDWVVAFQANTGDLWIYTPANAGNRDTGLGMAAGTSPAIAPDGSGFEVAFQANTGALWLDTPAGNVDTDLGMASGTSPAIAGSSGVFETAFQANTGDLWVYTPTNAGNRNTGLGMAAGTSPAIAPDGSGFEVAFQANTGALWTDTPAGNVDTDLGMAARTGPSIADGEVAFQANTGDLWVYTPTNAGDRDTGLDMAAGTSPSIADGEVAFQASTTDADFYKYAG
jgi:hypothetical protein